MTARPIALLTLLLLAACSRDKPEPAPAPAPATPRSVTVVEPVLPAHLRELSGLLSRLPRGSEVQLALLVIDARDRPQRLLASETVLATGEPMPFRLPFNPEAFPPTGGALRVELHARAIESGQLAWRLRPLRINQPNTQAMGELRLERVP